MATTKTRKKSKKKIQKKTEPINTYKLLWIEKDSMIVKCSDNLAKDAIFRFSKVQFGEPIEDGTVPISFTTDLLDNPSEIDFKASTTVDELDNYLGSLVTNIVMNALNMANEDAEYKMSHEGTVKNDENRDTDTK